MACTMPNVANEETLDANIDVPDVKVIRSTVRKKKTSVNTLEKRKEFEDVDIRKDFSPDVVGTKDTLRKGKTNSKKNLSPTNQEKVKTSKKSAVTKNDKNDEIKNAQLETNKLLKVVRSKPLTFRMRNTNDESNIQEKPDAVVSPERQKEFKSKENLEENNEIATELKSNKSLKKKKTEREDDESKIGKIDVDTSPFRQGKIKKSENSEETKHIDIDDIVNIEFKTNELKNKNRKMEKREVRTSIVKPDVEISPVRQRNVNTYKNSEEPQHIDNNNIINTGNAENKCDESTIINSDVHILFEKQDEIKAFENPNEMKADENNGIVNELEKNEWSKKNKVKNKDESKICKLNVEVKASPKRKAKRIIIKKLEDSKDIEDEENIAELQTKNVSKDSSLVSKQRVEDISTIEKEGDKNISNIPEEVSNMNVNKLLAILEEYKIENLNENFDYEATEIISPTVGTATKLKQEYRTILCGLLRENSFEIIQNNHRLTNLNGTFPEATSNFTTNGCSKETYKVTLLPRIVRNGKNCLRNTIIKSFAEKVHYTRGPDIYEKSANIPQIMERLADRKRVAIEQKLVKKKPFPLTTAVGQRKFSILSHIFTIRQVIEKCRLYNQILYLAFTEYEGESGASKIAEEEYKSSNAMRSKNELSNSYKSSKTLDGMFQLLNWCERGINVNGELLTHLRFDEYIVLFSDTEENMRNMLEELHRASETAKIRIDLNKTQILSTEKSKKLQYIQVLDKKVPLVAECVHLGQVLAFDNNQKRETERRIQLSKERFEKIKCCFQNMPLSDKKALFEKYILPVMTDGAETWNMSKQYIQRLRKAQLAMERVMLDLPAKEKISDREVRSRSGLTDVGNAICGLKWKWAGQLVCRKEERDFKFLFQVQTWSPDLLHRKGRPPAQWSDDVKKIAGVSWRRLQREEWRVLEEAYIKYWTSSGADSD